MRTFLLSLAGALVLAAPAAGGGFATVGLSPPGGGLGAGDTWNAEMTILQHGVTPLSGITPTVIVSNGKTTETFVGMPTGEPGVYLAEVKFPGEGTWTYRVDDGFSQTHTFAPVQIGPGTGDGGFAVPDWTWGILAAAGALAVLGLLARRSRPASAPVAQ